MQNYAWSQLPARGQKDDMYGKRGNCQASPFCYTLRSAAAGASRAARTAG
jgi:hypothetical protein